MQAITLNTWTFFSNNVNIGEYLRSIIIYCYKKKLSFLFSTNFSLKLKK